MKRRPCTAPTSRRFTTKVNTYIDNQESMLCSPSTIDSGETSRTHYREVPDFEQRLSTLTLDRFKAEVGK